MRSSHPLYPNAQCVNRTKNSSLCDSVVEYAMLLLVLAAPPQADQAQAQQNEQLEPTAVNVQHQRLTLGQINNLYRNGRPSNDVHLAGLFVHQPDSVEVRPPAKNATSPLPSKQHIAPTYGSGGGRWVGHKLKSVTSQPRPNIAPQHPP